MKRYIKKQYKYLLLALVCGLFEAWFRLKSTLYMGQLMDIMTGAVIAPISKYVLQSIMFLIVGFLFAYLSTKFTYKFGDNISSDIRIDVMSSLYEEPTTKFHANSIDSYLNLLDEDIDNIRVSFYYNIPFIIIGFIQIIIYAITLFKIHPIIFGLSTVFSLFPILVSRAFLNPVKNAQIIRSKTNEEYLSNLKEILLGYDTIKGTNRYDKFIDLFENVLSKRVNGIAKLNLMRAIIQRSMFLIATLGVIGILSIGGFLVKSNMITAGVLLSSIFIISNLTDALSNTVDYVMNVASSTPLLEKINSKIPKRKERSKFNDINKIETNFPIVLDSVGYRFENKALFSELNMKIKENECIAVIGYSGSGKSTLVKILLKYYEDYEGNIHFGQYPLKNLSERQVYDFIHVIPQSPFLIRSSLYNNIMMYNNRFPEDSEEFKSILEQVNLLDLYNTIGNLEKIEIEKLSGGEKQRIALARALASKSKMLILDEPTTGLDPDNQYLINNLIFELEDVTRIVITHNWDKNYLDKFDNILYLSK